MPVDLEIGQCEDLSVLSLLENAHQPFGRDSGVAEIEMIKSHIESALGPVGQGTRLGEAARMLRHGKTAARLTRSVLHAARLRREGLRSRRFLRQRPTCARG